MQSLATRRLIDAAATLEPADRALLNLWVNRGFDSDRLAALSRMPTATLVARRERIVEHLSETLGLPSDEVREALQELAASARAAVAAELNGASVADAEEIWTPRLEAETVNGTARPAVAGLLLGPAAARRADPGTPGAPGAPGAPGVRPAGLLLGPAAAHPPDRPGATTAAVAAPPTEPVPPPPRRTRRGAMPWLGAGLLIVVIGLLVAALASGGGATPRPAIAAASSPTTTPAVDPTSPAPTPAPPTRSAGGPVTAALAGLPGGLAGASGSVQLVGASKYLRLRLRVTGLPTPRRGHDEVWLFNSVLDSRALGRLRAGVPRDSYRLPANARRFRWIDVSFQPVGVVNHSGESLVRAPNPAHTATARRRRATR